MYIFLVDLKLLGLREKDKGNEEDIFFLKAD